MSRCPVMSADTGSKVLQARATARSSNTKFTRIRPRSARAYSQNTPSLQDIRTSHNNTEAAPMESWPCHLTEPWPHSHLYRARPVTTCTSAAVRQVCLLPQPWMRVRTNIHRQYGTPRVDLQSYNGTVGSLYMNCK